MSEPCHALVFRDVRERTCLSAICDATIVDLRAFQQSQDPELLLSALLRVGEMESALADRDSQQLPFNSYLLSRAITDPECTANFVACVISGLSRLSSQEVISVSRPEGFAFYGLHPSDYVQALESISLAGPQVIIGIRSIGLTLSAFLYAKLRLRLGDGVGFFTVRPSGHPYDRHCEFSEWQLSIVRRRLDTAKFLIVDEGPGMSGSSFLSVGEALVELGVKHEQIIFVCSRAVNPHELVTPNGAERWKKFQTKVAEQKNFTPEPNAISLAAGSWRNSYSTDEERPGLWTTMLRPIYQSASGKYIFEYHGLGHYGETLRRRINVLAEAGFTLNAERAANGFSRMDMVDGKRLTKSDITDEFIGNIAGYLAFRARAFAVGPEQVAASELHGMARFNFAQATGRELPEDYILELEHPVIADACMMPYAWARVDGPSRLLKLDCMPHGDGHFFPGPVDAAWDVAGAIIEWEMDENASSWFVRCYALCTGDDVSNRLPAYLIAYAAFRNGYCRMAASAMAHDPEEVARLSRDAQKYREVLEKLAPERKLAAVAYE